MTEQARPLILVTNDDGIASSGLLALVEALADLGDVLVSAPKQQLSASGRSLGLVGAWDEVDLGLNHGGVRAYAIEATPAVAARAGVLLFAPPRRIALAFAGINYGENIGTSITTSGTVCAAIETASFGIPSVAISLETDEAHHFSVSDAVDFSAAAACAYRLAKAILRAPLPRGADLLKVDVPAEATAETPWALTRLTRQRYFESTVEGIDTRLPRFTGYQRVVDRETLEPDSDAHALTVRRVISICPLTIDLSACRAPRLSPAWSRMDLPWLADVRHPHEPRTSLATGSVDG